MSVRAQPLHFEAGVETSTPTGVKALQLDGLRRFLRESVVRSEFHVKRAEAAGLRLGAIDSVEAFQALPLMRKRDVVADQGARPPFGTLLAVSASAGAHYVETSGTSGHGQERYLFSAEDVAGMRRQEAFGFVWAGVKHGNFVATTFPMTTKAAGRWHALGAEAAGGVYLPIGGLDARQKLDYLVGGLSVRALIATPSYVRRLEAEASRHGVDLRQSAVAAIMISGESFDEDWVRERQELWGARVYEQYGSSQRALVWSCENGALSADGQRGALHCPEHLALYEVIDPETGMHVEAGEFGEMIVTPFSSSNAMPLVRFASGDRVRYLGHDACACGRPFMSIEAGSISRYDDQVRVKGVNIEPGAIEAIVLKDPIVDYDVVIAIDELGREQVTLQVEARPPVTLEPQALEAVANRLRGATGLRFEVEQVAKPLPRDGQSGKRRRWHDLRNR